MNKLMIVTALLFCLALAPVAAADERLVLTCPISLDLNKKLDIRLNQLKGILDKPQVEKDLVWRAIFSSELFTLVDIQSANLSWYLDNCSES